MIELRPHAQGIVLPVRAQPGARRAAITGMHDGMLKVSVTAPPDKGKANQAIVELLCEALALSRSQVELLSGQTSRIKQLLIRDLSADEIVKRIAVCLNGLS
jgi:uncharacterized protein